MDIIVGANVDEAIAAFKRLGYTITKIEEQSNKLTTKGKTNWTNWTRVIQDMPYGFNAISNNLEQLIPAAGGAGLAFSALIAGLSFMQVGLSNWIRTSKEAKKATEDHAKSIKEYTKIVEDAQDSNAGNIAKVQALALVLEDSTKSLHDRKTALAELTKLDKEHFGALNAEKSSYQEIKTAVDAYTDSLIREAVVKGLTDDITELSKQIRKAEKDYVIAATNVDKANRLIGASQQQAVVPYSSTGFTTNVYGITEVTKATNQESEASQKLIGLRQQMVDLTGDLNKKVAEGITLTHTADKTTGDTIAKILADLNRQLGKTGLLEQALGVDKSQEKISEISSAIDRLLKIKVPPDSTIIKQLLGDISALELPQTLKAFGEYVKKNFHDAIEKAPYEPIKPADIGMSFSDVETEAAVIKMRESLRKAGVKVFSAQGILTGVDLLNDKEVQDNYANMEDKTKALANVIATDLGGAFDSVFQAIEQGKNVFASLGSYIKKLTLQLVEAAIEAAALAFIFSLLPGGTAFSLGAVKNIFGGLTGIKAAGGAIVTKPTIALVGEQGPERITPLGYEGQASNAMAGEVVFNISGNNLRGVLRRADQTAYNTF